MLAWMHDLDLVLAAVSVIGLDPSCRPKIDTTLPLLVFLTIKQGGEFAFIDDVNRLTAAVFKYLPPSRFRNDRAHERMTHRVYGFPIPPKKRIKHADLQD